MSDDSKKLGGGNANAMRALRYRVTPPPDPSDGACWEMRPPSGDVVYFVKDEQEGWEKAHAHWAQSAMGRLRIEPAAEPDPAPSAARITALEAEVVRLQEALVNIEAEMRYPNQLEAGFAHSRMTFGDAQNRIITASSIAREALAATGAA